MKRLGTHSAGNLITFDEVRDWFDYRDGKLYCRKTHHNTSKNSIGDEAGYFNKKMGRWRVKFKRRHYFRSRLIYLWHHGKWPEPTCDHIDGNTLNDRIENLREASVSVNSINKKSNPKSKFKFIYKAKRDIYEQGFRWMFAIKNTGNSKTIK